MNGTLRLSEQMRRASAWSTRTILRRYGNSLGMYMGCGFPKSGTVWMCQLLGTTLGVPYPREYRLPIAMESIIHTHWRYDDKYPPTAYIRRDGRDVMLSLYFFYVRALAMTGKPGRARDLRDMFNSIYGPKFDPSAVKDNLPKFIETQANKPKSSGGLAWHQHVSDWWGRPNVAHLSYEELISDPVTAVSRVTKELRGTSEHQLAELAVDRWSFSTTTNRQSGEEDRTSFLRKGIVGDWKNYYNRDAGEVFDSIAGPELVEFGYATDRNWFSDL